MNSVIVSRSSLGVSDPLPETLDGPAEDSRSFPCSDISVCWWTGVVVHGIVDGAEWQLLRFPGDISVTRMSYQQCLRLLSSDKLANSARITIGVT